MGAPKKYNDEWIIANYNNYPFVKDLAAAYNKKFNDNISRRTLAHHCEDKLGLHKNLGYTEEQDEWLKSNFSKLGRKECTKQFNEKFGTNKLEGNLKVHCNRDLKLKITKTDKSLHHSPKYSEGHEIFHKNSGYIFVKSSDRNAIYITKQRYIYEKAHGKIPKGYSVIFLDGDRTNFDLDNLMCIPNGYIRAVMHQRYSPFIRKHEDIPNDIKIKVNKEIIRMYELEKTLKEGD